MQHFLHGSETDPFKRLKLQLSKLLKSRKKGDEKTSPFFVVCLPGGGARRDRTADLLLAKQVLSQLSYGPLLVGLGRVELPTSPLSGVRSNQLSYRPEVLSEPSNLCGCS